MQENLIEGGGEQGEQARQRGEEFLPPRRLTSKIPRYDPAESVDQYLARVDFWFELENVRTDGEKFRILVPQLPGNMFSEARNANLSGRPDGYKELKKLLIATFDMNEMERVRRLTETVQLGNRRPGDVLREMQQLAVTTDERVLKNLWLQRLPPELGAALSTSRDLPIATLRDMANTIHGFMPGQSVAQISVPAPVRNQHQPSSTTQPPTMPGLGDLITCIGQLVVTLKEQHAVTITAIERRDTPNHTRSRSSQRDSFRGSRTRSESRSSEPDFDDQGRCWYHSTFGDRARKCKPGCALGGFRQ